MPGRRLCLVPRQRLPATSSRVPSPMLLLPRFPIQTSWRLVISAILLPADRNRLLMFSAMGICILFASIIIPPPPNKSSLPLQQLPKSNQLSLFNVAVGRMLRRDFSVPSSHFPLNALKKKKKESGVNCFPSTPSSSLFTGCLPSSLWTETCKH